MTAPRPEDGPGLQGPYVPGAYGADGAFTPAVEGLVGPLGDPLPGQHTSPWFRSGATPEEGGPTAARPQAYGPEQAQEAPGEWYDPEGYQRDWYGSQQAPAPSPAPVPADETMGLRTADTRRIVTDPGERPDPPQAFAPADAPRPYDSAAPYEPVPQPYAPAGERPAPEPYGAVTERPVPAERPEPSDPYDPAEPYEPPARPESAEPVTGGRAERRRAAKGRGRRSGPAAPAASTPAAPMTRMEARRAAKAAKDSPAVVASRAVGEIFISLGVLMLLFVTYQLWWTNVRAEQIAGKETNRIQEEWANGAGKPGVFAPGQGFAIMHIPKLDVVVPIAEGIDKEKVLDRGMLGHYGEGKLKTAMPEDEQGNFAVAGHRNTHGEPFRYVNKLVPGDPIVVETRDAYYTYEMTSILPQTSPSNISVIEPIPAGSGFTEPGRYITLTTCTPEFTSTYRLIVWGKMVDERPRDEGKPKALVG
ncbi:class E sortase [Streptomyces bacillaris]|uniref:class E sortase n=1 Tax=Streptomyces TaxID=1883 RepID=UPI00158772D2|nr:class E sortase [Streptomyces sp. KAI-26]NUV87373.1 class E sortase [Streptomyces sp. KAI-26]NUW22262.1 class E sortase [Streptomyces roseoviolaceus]